MAVDIIPSGFFPAEKIIVDTKKKTVSIGGEAYKYDPDAVSWGDWCPWNQWQPAWPPSQLNYAKRQEAEIDPVGDYWSAAAIIDMTTQKPYGHEELWSIRTKCFALVLGTPFVHIAASIYNVAYRVFLLVAFVRFWKSDEEYTFSAKLLNCAKDLLRIIATPLAIIGLELAAIYGVFNPLDGRKLYATIERAEYGHFILAPCFQPDPVYHLFSGRINKENPSINLW